MKNTKLHIIYINSSINFIKIIMKIYYNILYLKIY